MAKEPRPLEDYPDLLTIPEYAEFTRQGLTKSYEDVRRERIASIRLGRTIRIPRRALEELLDGKVEAAPLRVVK